MSTPHALGYRALAYTGSNSADLLDLAELATQYTWSIDSEGGGVLVLEFAVGGDVDTITLNTGNFLVFTPATLAVQVLTAAAYAARYSDHGPQAAVSAGSAPVPTLGASASTTVGVTIAPAQAGTTYSAAAHLVGSSTLLADLEILSTTVVDSDTVNVVVRNNALLSLGGATAVVTAIGRA